MSSFVLLLLLGIISVNLVDLGNASPRLPARNVDILMDGSSDQCGTQVESLSGSIFSHAGRAQHQEERERRRREKIEEQRIMREAMASNVSTRKGSDHNIDLLTPSPSHTF